MKFGSPVINIFVFQKKAEEERMRRGGSLGSAGGGSNTRKPTLVIQVPYPLHYVDFFLIKHCWVGVFLEKHLFFEARHFVAVHQLWWISSGTEVPTQCSWKGWLYWGQTSSPASPVGNGHLYWALGLTDTTDMVLGWGSLLFLPRERQHF